MTDEPIYQEQILDHAKAPRHYGELRDFAQRRTGVNPLCGDEVTLFARRDGPAQVLQFVSKGCALCRASASLMLEAAAAAPRTQWPVLRPGPALADVAAAFPSRTRCVQLPWETFTQMLPELVG